MLKYNEVPLELINENITLTPVDDCARAIFYLMKLQENNVYNLFSQNSMSIGNYMKALSNNINLINLNDFNEQLKLANDDSSKFVEMYIKGILTNPEKSVVQIYNNDTNKTLEKINFRWSDLGDKYVRMFRYIGGK